MKYRLVMQWPSADILPLVQEAETATAAIKMCVASVRSGCELKKIFRIDDAGAIDSLLPRELVHLARDEGCRIKFPPRVRRRGKTLSSILLAIVASMLPNYFGDFCTLLELGACRVAIRREEGARRPTRRIATEDAEKP